MTTLYFTEDNRQFSGYVPAREHSEAYGYKTIQVVSDEKPEQYHVFRRGKWIVQSERPKTKTGKRSTDSRPIASFFERLKQEKPEPEKETRLIFLEKNRARLRDDGVYPADSTIAKRAAYYRRQYQKGIFDLYIERISEAATRSYFSLYAWDARNGKPPKDNLMKVKNL